MDTLLRMEAKISPALGAIEPAIFLLLGVCSTAVLQLLLKVVLILVNAIVIVMIAEVF